MSSNKTSSGVRPRPRRGFCAISGVVLGIIIIGGRLLTNLSNSLSSSPSVWGAMVDVLNPEQSIATTNIDEDEGRSSTGDVTRDTNNSTRTPYPQPTTTTPITSTQIATMSTAESPNSDPPKLQKKQQQPAIVPREHLIRLLKVTLDLVNVDHDEDTVVPMPSVDDLSRTELDELLNNFLTQARLGFLMSSSSFPLYNTTTTAAAASAGSTPPSSSGKQYSYPSMRLLENILGVRIYRQHQKPGTKTFTHFLSHIPKSGTSYAFGLLCDMLWNQKPDYFALDPHDRFRPCSAGTSQPFTFATNKWRGHTKKHVCNLWMSEAPWTPMAQSTYIVLRQPKHHVLSQYFHCTESREHGNRAKLASTTTLTDWLQAWTAAIHNPSQAQSNGKFFCYKPFNLQSTYVFPNAKIGSSNINNDRRRLSAMVPPSRTNLTALYEFFYSTSGAGNFTVPTDEESGELESFRQSIFDDLQHRFVVVGDTSQMTLSVCLIFIHYTSWIPASCDCTNATFLEEEEQEGGSVGGFDPSKHSHGVQHHGATYPTTPVQDELIHQLTLLDQLIYEVGRDVLKHQVQKVEQDYQIRLCRTLSSTT